MGGDKKLSLDNKVMRESFRATEEEDKALSKSAKALNMKKSEYIRYKIFGNNNSEVDVFEKLQRLKEKYIVLKYNTKDITKSHAINMEIQGIDKIIKNLERLEKGEELEI